jgi:hypothetical protein
MRVKGSASWRLSLDNPQSLDIALFVRDSVGLVAPPSPEVPPLLALRTSDHTAVLTDAARIEAGGQWLGWWRRLIAFEISPRPSPGSDEEWVAQSRRSLDEYQRVMDPPDFDSMADLPALRTAAATTFNAATGWLSATRRPATRPPLLDQTLLRDVVQEVIAAHGVSPDRLDAAVLVLDVAGAWQYLARPGAVFCSTSTFNDPVAVRSLLREAFVSGLDA